MKRKSLKNKILVAVAVVAIVLSQLACSGDLVGDMMTANELMSGNDTEQAE